MRRALAVPALCLATILSGCANTAFVLKEPVKEYSEGNFVWGTVMLVCLPVMVPIFMVADAFEFLNVSEQDVAVVAQAGQDYVAARAAQDQANAQAQAQAQGQMLAMQQQQQQQQRQQQQEQQQARQAQPTSLPASAPPADPAASAQQQYLEMQRQQVAMDNAQAQEQARRLREQNQQYLAQHANASKCLSLVPMETTLYGGFVNSCSYKVNLTWCNDGATGEGLGNFSDGIDCRRGSLGAESVGPNGRVGAHTNAPRVFWMACKAPFTPVKAVFNGNGVIATCR